MFNRISSIVAVIVAIGTAAYMVGGLEVRVQNLEANETNDLDEADGFVNRLLTHSIILTDQDCAILGDNWQRYEAMDGKMPLATGGHTDYREETRTFIVGQSGGTYGHQLTPAEMPTHSHMVATFEWGHTINGNGHPARIDVDDGGPWNNTKGRLHTNERGENEPHNNMPPYRVLNFCHNVGN